MTPVPYTAKISRGAHAYNSPLTLIDWGLVTYEGVVNIGSEWLGYARVDNPVWPKNGKPYWVDLDYVMEYVPPDPPPPTLSPVTRTGNITLDMPDGTTLTNQDDIVWIPK